MKALTCYIALGSNLEGPQQQLTLALQALAKLPASTLICTSSFYRSKAVGPGEQNDYINAACKLKTELGAHDLLRALQQIENDQGRIRLEHWGPRTLDLDLLLYGQETINTENLYIPHPRMYERDFVLYPLYEIAPELQLPCRLGLPKQVALESLLEQLSDTNLVRLNSESER